MDIPQFFLSDLLKLNICLDDEQLAQFMRYIELLMASNKRMNLTSITERNEICKKHFIDSLALVNYGIFAGGSQAPNINIIDVGSGAGFPGIPLKIAFPRLDVTLLDAREKRVAFLDHVIGELGLAGIRAVHSRAEDMARLPAYRDGFDLCVSRAVAQLFVLAEYCLPFVKRGGLFVAYKANGDGAGGGIRESNIAAKGHGLARELAEAEKHVALLGGRFDRCVEYDLPHSDIARVLVGISKVSPTPDKFPRRAGMAAKGRGRGLT